MEVNIIKIYLGITSRDHDRLVYLRNILDNQKSLVWVVNLTKTIVLLNLCELERGNGVHTT